MPAQIAAKVIKRVGQLRRLGGRGLVRTAYVRTLGPSAYSLTEPARSIATALHRQKALTRALSSRLRLLKIRAAALRDEAATGVRHVFGTDVGQFVQTLEAMLDLKECAVPRVLNVEWGSNTITCEAVKAKPFSQYRRDGGLNEHSIRLAEDALLAIHRAGYALGEIDEDDLLITADNRSVISRLDRAVPLAGLSRDMSIHLRDADRRRFNQLFGASLLTAAQLRTLLSPKAQISRDRAHGFTEVYAPVVLRDDIRWGKIWNTDLGIGRWNYIMKEHLPIPKGGSVLDLGSNNGFNPLQMLRAGAASAVGVEIQQPAIEQAKFLKSAYEWLDNRLYDFRCIHGSQGDLAKFDLQRFDVVTALCSLYYLSADEIRDLVRYIRTLTDVLVLQCNEDRLIDRGGSDETFRKASVEFAVQMLEQAGFADRRIIAPPGYSRPLVIGRAA